MLLKWKDASVCFVFFLWSHKILNLLYYLYYIIYVDLLKSLFMNIITVCEMKFWSLNAPLDTPYLCVTPGPYRPHPPFGWALRARRPRWSRTCSPNTLGTGTFARLANQKPGNGGSAVWLPCWSAATLQCLLSTVGESGRGGGWEDTAICNNLINVAWTQINYINYKPVINLHYPPVQVNYFNDIEHVRILLWISLCVNYN